MPRVSPGLRHRIVVQARHVLADVDGGQRVFWMNVVDDEPAAVVPLRGEQFFAAAQVNSLTAYKVVVRYRPDVRYSPFMRIKWEDRIFDVEGALEKEGRGRLVELMCRERAPAGFHEDGIDVGNVVVWGPGEMDFVLWGPNPENVEVEG